MHRGQGFLVDLLEGFLVAVAGISEEKCGIRQASILVHNKLHAAALSRVDSFGYGRIRYPFLEKQIDENVDWLWNFLITLEKKIGSTCG